MSYASAVTCQPLGYSKCRKICDTDGYNKQTRKVLTVKPKAPSFHTKKVSYLNFFPEKKHQVFGFWTGQSLKLRRNSCFCGLKSSFPVNFQYQKLKGLPLQKWEVQSFAFQKGPVWQRFLANQLGGLEYNIRCLKWFSRKLPLKLRTNFFLQLRSLKIQLLFTWLKCLIVY